MYLKYNTKVHLVLSFMGVNVKTCNKKFNKKFHDFHEVKNIFCKIILTQLISSLCCLDFEKFSIEENPDSDLEYVDVGFHGEDALHHEEGFQEEEEFGGDDFGGDSGNYG